MVSFFIFKINIRQAFIFQVELQETENTIEELRKSILEMAPDAPGGQEAITWPVGSQETIKPGNRFDVLQWDYFTEIQVFPESDFSAVKQLSDSEKIDIEVSF
jgi:hypothetical protein